MKCLDCGEVTELYDFLIDKILQAPEPGISSVEVLSISPRDRTPTLTLVSSGGNGFSQTEQRGSERSMGIDAGLIGEGTTSSTNP